MAAHFLTGYNSLWYNELSTFPLSLSASLFLSSIYVSHSHPSVSLPTLLSLLSPSLFYSFFFLPNSFFYLSLFSLFAFSFLPTLFSLSLNPSIFLLCLSLTTMSLLFLSFLTFNASLSLCLLQARKWIENDVHFKRRKKPHEKRCYFSFFFLVFSSFKWNECHSQTIF